MGVKLHKTCAEKLDTGSCIVASSAWIGIANYSLGKGWGDHNVGFR
jgi:hypothetical protein